MHTETDGGDRTASVKRKNRKLLAHEKAKDVAPTLAAYKRFSRYPPPLRPQDESGKAGTHGAMEYAATEEVVPREK